MTYLSVSDRFNDVTREFDACSMANAEKKKARSKNMRAFLREPAASHFYAIPADDSKTHKNAVKMLIGAMCHKAQRENFYAECIKCV